MQDRHEKTPSGTLKPQKRRDRQEDISPAGLVALFEEVFQPWKDRLAVKMFVATLISLAERDIVELDFKKKPRFLGLGASTELLIRQKREIPKDALGRRIAALVSRVDARVRDILLSCWLRCCPNPHKDVERWVKEELVEMGFMEKTEEKTYFKTRDIYNPIPIMVSSLRSRALDLKMQMDQFRRQYPEVYEKLRYEVNFGLELQTVYPV